MQQDQLLIMLASILFLSSYLRMSILGYALCSLVQSNDVHTQQLLDTLNERINAAIDDKPETKLPPFTAIQLNEKHVKVVDLVDLCLEICSEEKPDVMTIITVKQYYDDEKGTKGNDYVPIILSEIQKCLAHGNRRDICQNPLVVSVHIVKKNAFMAYSANSLSMDAISLLHKRYNALAFDHILEILHDELVKLLKNVVREIMINAISEDLVAQNDRATPRQDWDIKTFFEPFVNHMRKKLTTEALLKNKQLIYFDGNGNKYLNNFFFKLKEYYEKIATKAHISKQMSLLRDFIDLNKAKCGYLLERMANEIILGTRTFLGEPSLRMNFKEAFKAEFKRIVVAMKNDSFDFAVTPKGSLIIDVDIDDYFNLDQQERFYQKLFVESGIVSAIIDDVAESEILMKTKSNNNFCMANSTKIILNKKLSKDDIPSLHHILINLNLFERIKDNQIMFLAIGNANENLAEKASEILCQKGNLSSLVNHSDSDCPDEAYKYSITGTKGANNIITSTLLYFKYNNDAKIIETTRETSDRNLYRDHSSIRVDRYNIDDYSININQKITVFIDKHIVLCRRKVIEIYKILSFTDVLGADDKVVYIILHEEIGGTNDRKLSIAFDTGLSAAATDYKQSKEANGQISYFHNVPSLFVKTLNAQLNSVQGTAVNLAIPNYFRFNGADFYYSEQIIRQK